MPSVIGVASMRQDEATASSLFLPQYMDIMKSYINWTIISQLIFVSGGFLEKMQNSKP